MAAFPGIPLRSIPGCYIPTPSGFDAEILFFNGIAIQNENFATNWKLRGPPPVKSRPAVVNG
jgi:hypothetical protein